MPPEPVAESVMPTAPVAPVMPNNNVTTDVYITPVWLLSGACGIKLFKSITLWALSWAILATCSLASALAKCSLAFFNFCSISKLL